MALPSSFCRWPMQGFQFLCRDLMEQPSLKRPPLNLRQHLLFHQYAFDFFFWWLFMIHTVSLLLWYLMNIRMILFPAVKAPLREPNCCSRKSHVCWFKWEIGNYYFFLFFVSLGYVFFYYISLIFLWFFSKARFIYENLNCNRWAMLLWALQQTRNDTHHVMMLC